MEIDRLTSELSETLDIVLIQRRRAQAVVVLAAVAGVFIAGTIVFTQFIDQKIVAVIPLIAVYFIVRWILDSFTKSLSGFTMPILCKMAGGYSFVADVPNDESRYLAKLGLLPNKGKITCQNMIDGTLGDKKFETWSCKAVIETDGGDSEEFGGFLLKLPAFLNSGDMLVRPAQSMILQKLRDVFGSPLSGSHQVKRDLVVDSGTDFTLFLKTAEREQEIFDWVKTRIIRTNEALGRDARFHGLLGRSTESFVAISDKNPMCAVNGLFASKASLLREMHHAMGEISLLLKLVEIWQAD